MPARAISTAYPRVRVIRTPPGTLAIPAGTDVVIPWTAAVLDTHGMWNPAAPTLLTVPIGGLWVAVLSSLIDNVAIRAIARFGSPPSAFPVFYPFWSTRDNGSAYVWLTAAMELAAGESIQAMLRSENVPTTATNEATEMTMWRQAY